jgi:hypothetical protein
VCILAQASSSGTGDGHCSPCLQAGVSWPDFYEQ